MTKVAIIGLGNMGSGMADNLVKGKFDVTAFDLSETALEKEPPGRRIRASRSSAAGIPP